MAKSSKPETTQTPRSERVLGGMAAGVLIASVVSILAIVAFAALSLNNLIAIVVVFPMVGLPIGAVLLLSLVAVRFFNQRRK